MVEVSVLKSDDPSAAAVLLMVEQANVVNDGGDPNAQPQPVEAAEVALSYADFAMAFGGGWSDRLSVTAYPQCYLTTPELPECTEGISVPTVNDPATQTVTFTTGDLATDPWAEPAPEPSPAPSESPSPAPSEPPSTSPSQEPSTSTAPSASPAPDGANWTGTLSVAPAVSATPAATSGSGTLFAVTADSTNYGATPLSLASGWQVGEGSGEFTYSYDFDLPEAKAGQTPELSLRYSSGAVDGMTNVENGQASMAGIGWDFSVGYVTRNYAACKDDGLSTKGDLCWRSDGAGLINEMTMVLGGRASALVKVPGTAYQYRLRDDPAWRISLLSSASPATGEPKNRDNDNEAFKVLAPDGTTYWFGWGNGTNSVWTVPVFGNDAGEPCKASTVASSYCQQGWRWNLDRVIDAHGNVIVYNYDDETNYYSRYGNTGVGNRQEYDKGGWLTSIQYGYKADGTIGARQIVDVKVLYRCTGQVDDPSADCTGAHGPRAEPGKWPDTPSDLICDANDTICDNISPSFFSTHRYSQVVTKTVNGTTTWLVDRYDLDSRFPDPDGPTGKDLPDLWLNHIDRTSIDGGQDAESLPVVDFAGVALRNRVVAGTGERQFNRFRIESVRNETGGRIDIRYGHADNRKCDADYVTNRARWTSTRECFAQKWAPLGKTPKWEWFHKYVVTRLALGDDTMGYGLNDATPANPTLGELRVYDYLYSGAPAWRYADSLNVPTDAETWSDWRGYEQTVIETRKVENQQPLNGQDPVARRRVVVYRGMDQSKSNISGDRVTVKLDTVEYAIAADEPNDSAWLQGRVAEEAVQTPTGGHIWRTYNDYVAWVTAQDPRTWDARVTALKSTKTSRNVVGQADNREESVAYILNDGGTDHLSVLAGAVREVRDMGVVGDSTDNTCTVTDWAYNTTRWMRKPKQVTVHDTGCDSATAANAVSDQFFYYDQTTSPGGLTASALGELLQTRTMTNNQGTTTADYIDTRTDYDAFGRVQSVTDGRGNTTTYTYNPGANAADLLTKFRVTDPTGETTEAVLTARRGQPRLITDANGKNTTLNYDGLGRLLEVTYPDNTTGTTTGTPSVQYAYRVDGNNAPRITTKTLRTAGTTPETSYAFFDGWGRPVGTRVPQARPGAGGVTGQVATMIRYDEMGLPAINVPAIGVATPGAEPYNADPAGIPDHLRSTYDAAGRPVAVARMDVNAANQLVTAWTDRTTYGGDRVETYRVAGAATSPAADDLVTVTYQDSHNQPTRIVQQAGGTQLADASYDFNATGLLTQIQTTLKSDASGVPTTVAYGYTYDDAGRRISATDPDTGTTTYGYDKASNLTRVDAPAAPPIVTVYDPLDRPTSRKVEGSATTLADWTYDNANPASPLPNDGFDGRLVSTTAHTQFGDFTDKVTGYTVTGNPTGTTTSWPRSLTELATSGATDSYTLSYGYDLTGTLTSTTYPAVARGTSTVLPAETVDTAYGYSGLYTAVKSSNAGVTTTLATATYDTLNRTDTLTSPATSGNSGLQRDFNWGLANRLSDLTITNNLSSDPLNLLKLSYSYDKDGNRTRVDGTSQSKDALGNTVTAAGAWCYTYDPLNRLSAATAGAGAGCTGPGDPSVYGARYDLAYGFTGTELSTVTDRSTGAAAGYTYATGDATPHGFDQLTTVTAPPTGTAAVGLPDTGTVQYDAAGRITAWTPTDSTKQGATYGYDDQGNHISTTPTRTGTAPAVANAYTAGGLRIVRRVTDKPLNNTTTTLYLGATEITVKAPSAGSSPTEVAARRTLATPTGTPIAQHTTDGFTWVAADLQNNVRVTRGPNGGGQVNNYYPYGEPTGATNDLPGGHGYLNKIHDPNGDLRLDHRNYTPELNLFTTPDPLLAPYDPANLNPYSYSRSNPIALSDGSGLVPTEDNSDGGHSGPNGTPPGTHGPCGTCGHNYTPPPDKPTAPSPPKDDGGVSAVGVAKKLLEIVLNQPASPVVPSNGTLYANPDGITHLEFLEVTTPLPDGYRCVTSGNNCVSAFAAVAPTPGRGSKVLFMLGDAIRGLRAARVGRVAAKTADDWPVLSGIVRDAGRGKGNYGLGSGTASQATRAGESWVGEGYRIASDGKTLVSRDGLRTFRPPTWKPNEGKYQANFEYWIGVREGKSFGNGHLDITDIVP